MRKVIILSVMLSVFAGLTSNHALAQNENPGRGNDKKDAKEVTPAPETAEAEPTASPVTPTVTPASPTPTAMPSITPTVNTLPAGNAADDRRDDLTGPAVGDTERNPSRDNPVQGQIAPSEPLSVQADHSEAFLDTREDPEETGEEKAYPVIIPKAFAEGLGNIQGNYYLSGKIDPITNINLFLSALFFTLSGVVLLKIAPKRQPQGFQRFTWEPSGTF